mmetsp:Transcript_1885/g.3613  ORF Transcript_1885/g.3613 Transcript_1885/m.3613 type:complete len:296 (+) Transcript_1885:809-1696(+)
MRIFAVTTRALANLAAAATPRIGPFSRNFATGAAPRLPQTILIGHHERLQPMAVHLLLLPLLETHDIVRTIFLVAMRTDNDGAKLLPFRGAVYYLVAGVELSGGSIKRRREGGNCRISFLRGGCERILRVVAPTFLRRYACPLQDGIGQVLHLLRQRLPLLLIGREGITVWLLLILLVVNHIFFFLAWFLLLLYLLCLRKHLFPCSFPKLFLFLIFVIFPRFHQNMGIISLLLPAVFQSDRVVWLHQIVQVSAQNFSRLYPRGILVANMHPHLVHGHHFSTALLGLGLDHFYHCF